MEDKSAKSQRWIRAAVRDHEVQFSDRVRNLFRWPQDDAIRWVSPLAADGYVEYHGEEFLTRLGIQPLEVPLKQFWPRSGPRWDALARTSSGNVLLVEAKAHIGEGLPTRTRAVDEQSRSQIERSLAEAKKAFRASEQADWNSPFYQYANRLAHLYFLRQTNRIPAHLLFVYFADAPDVAKHERTSAEQWDGAKRAIESAMGLNSRNPFRAHVETLIWSVPEMLGRS